MHALLLCAALAVAAAENQVPAVGVGIIREGKLAEVKVCGELARGTPAGYDAIFNVASLTKPVVTLTVLQLVKAGKWDLDQPLAKDWIDPDVAGDPRHAKLTTRHVLSHQTGFANWRWLEATKKLTFQFEPGTRVQYSGEGSSTCGARWRSGSGSRSRNWRSRSSSHPSGCATRSSRGTRAPMRRGSRGGMTRTGRTRTPAT